jgi:hypothetical protein
MLNARDVVAVRNDYMRDKALGHELLVGRLLVLVNVTASARPRATTEVPVELLMCPRPWTLVPRPSAAREPAGQLPGLEIRRVSTLPTGGILFDVFVGSSDAGWAASTDTDVDVAGLSAQFLPSLTRLRLRPTSDRFAL